MKINKQRLIDTFINLVKIPSPSNHEDEVFNLIEKHLSEIGFNVKIKEYGNAKNLYAALDSNADLPPILLSAHADTVEPCENINPINENGIIKSDGSTILGGDDKCAIAEIIEAMYIIKEQSLPHGKIEIAVTSAEEIGLQGAKNLDMNEFKSKHSIVLDASGDIGSVITGAPYHDVFKIVFKGKKAHAGIEPENGINAIKAAACFITRFKTGRIDKETVTNLGKINGGGATNIVPDEVILTGEIRSHNAKKLKKQKANLFKALKKTSEVFNTDTELEYKREYNAFSTPANNPLLGIIKASCESIGIAFQTKIAGGGSDANILNERGINCVNIACGMRKVHTNKEYVIIDELESTTCLLIDILTNRMSHLNS